MLLAIRKATAEDAAIIALLGQITFRQAFNHFWKDEIILQNYFKQTFSFDKIKSSLAKPNNIFWLAFVDGLPMGYAKLKLNSFYEHLTYENPAQLQKIYLLNDYIGQHVGEKLQNEICKEVIQRGIKTLWLAVWNENEKAIRFYEKHGFLSESTYHFDFEKMSIDYFVMVKQFK